MVTCKMICSQITKHLPYGQSKDEFIHGYKFSVVTGNTDDDKKYFAWTPSGSLEFDALRGFPFEIGKKYYVTINEAPD